MRVLQRLFICFQLQNEDSALASPYRHNLRPKRTMRHVNALKQQEKRRKRNTTIAASEASPNNQTASPTLIRTASARKLNNSSVGGRYFDKTNLAVMAQCQSSGEFQTKQETLKTEECL